MKIKLLIITVLGLLLAGLIQVAYGQALDIVKRDITATREVTVRDTPIVNLIKFHGGGGGGGVTPISSFLYWNSVTNTYEPFSDSTGSGAKAGIYYGTQNPTKTTRVNYNHIIHSSGFRINSAPSVGISIVNGSNNGITISTTSANGLFSTTSTGNGVYGQVTGNGSALKADISSALSGNSAGKLVDLQRTGSHSTYNITGDIISITDNPITSGTISGKVLTATIGSTEIISMNPRVTDGASAVAYMFDTYNALNNTGAKIASFKNQGTEKASIDKDGVIEVTTAGQGIILKSPDGTRYKITVANGGTLSVISL